ncbi:MAG: hypothetical protein JW741_10005 [Sedimentisphaerales bacterium]|nr:hypothetical protein [Sedimentisphaerales bacterium]
MRNKANSAGQDCRVVSLLAMTPARGDPLMPNKANFAKRRVGGHGPPYGMAGKAPEGRNVKQTQFAEGPICADFLAERAL